MVYFSTFLHTFFLTIALIATFTKSATFATFATFAIFATFATFASFASFATCLLSTGSLEKGGMT